MNACVVRAFDQRCARDMGSDLRAWTLLGIAIIGELVGTAALKLANGLEHPWAWLGVALGYGVALWLLDEVVERLDIGVVNALWSGVGIGLVALCGVLFFDEIMSWPRGLGLLAIIGGIVLIQLDDRAAAKQRDAQAERESTPESPDGR